MPKTLVIMASPGAREFAESLVDRLSVHADSVTVQDVDQAATYPLRIRIEEHISEGGEADA